MIDDKPILHWACERGDLMQRFEKNMSVELFDNLGYWGIADLLVSNGIDVDFPDDYGKTALQWASGSG